MEEGHFFAKKCPFFRLELFFLPPVGGKIDFFDKLTLSPKGLRVFSMHSSPNGLFVRAELAVHIADLTAAQEGQRGFEDASIADIALTYQLCGIHRLCVNSTQYHGLCRGRLLADRALLQKVGSVESRKSIAIINKSDLGNVVSEEELSPFVSAVITLSAKDTDCYEQMRVLLEDLLGTADFDPSAAMLANERQLDCVHRAMAAIREAIDGIELGLTMDALSVCVDDAIAPLLELTGESVSDTIIEQVFATFCVGK